MTNMHAPEHLRRMEGDWHESGALADWREHLSPGRPRPVFRLRLAHAAAVVVGAGLWGALIWALWGLG